ncbi:MAG: histidinol dehydrogenase, partial [Candidatus Omnitrophica bacterium]|nr:histidinol dehydrogenase [Candidatus Omnitrophota bacterium]
MKIIRFTSKQLEKIYSRGQLCQPRVEEKVRKIISDVRLAGDEALLKYTRKFDKAKVNLRQLKV